MRFPDGDVVDAALSDPALPRFARVRYDPETPTLDDVRGRTRTELDALPLEDLPTGATVAVGLGSRGIHDVVPIARTVVDELRARGFDPVVVPAMGSHGGATAEGQREALAGIGLTEDALGCPIDARMETTTLGESAVGAPVPFSTAALAADGVVVVNRVKAHTNFTGRFESGLTKMATIGLGKRAGAKAAHEHALDEGYVPVIEAAYAVVRESTPLLGGIAVVENFHDRTAAVEGVPAADLPDAEEPLKAAADEYMPTLPYDDLDVLVVDRIGKDVSGAGMDTNVIGRYRVLNADDPASPSIDRIVVRGLTEATHGNGNGIGLADLTTRAAVEDLDLDQVYTNALTSNSLRKATVPVVLPDDQRAIVAALSTIGTYDPETVRMAWIRDTGHLSAFRVSEALAREAPDAVEVDSWLSLSFVDGEPSFEPVDRD
ncbi:lactate racemase domain-containing protein [Haloplanus salinarum]|uniref:lactate racemase domain-containing protein n=1 Tax=Haloplanus salinarum TaxID=1912324 RepID=UPI00214BDA7C|nr:lactate racemase domain-containing protein [Haloplanus salinarum]